MSKDQDQDKNLALCMTVGKGVHIEFLINEHFLKQNNFNVISFSQFSQTLSTKTPEAEKNWTYVFIGHVFSKSVCSDGLVTAVNDDRHPKYHGRDKLYNKKVISINT